VKFFILILLFVFMKGIDSWAVAAGLFFVVLGAFLLVISFVAWPVFFYAVGLLVIGIVILVTLKQQEYIEPIRKNKKPVRSKRK
jgi:hypothetical protein